MREAITRNPQSTITAYFLEISQKQAQDDTILNHKEQTIEQNQDAKRLAQVGRIGPSGFREQALLLKSGVIFGRAARVCFGRYWQSSWVGFSLQLHSTAELRLLELWETLDHYRVCPGKRYKQSSPACLAAPACHLYSKAESHVYNQN